ncbi:MAG: cell division ATP-binding protein FtsE [Panacagrimonas sp.]
MPLHLIRPAIRVSTLLEFHDVSYHYPGGPPVLDGISFRLEPGEMVFLTGASGAGKSTLLKLIALQVRASRGKVLVNEQNLADIPQRKAARHRRSLGLIFQDFGLLPDRNTFDNVALPLIIRGVPDQDRQRRVRAALNAVGLLGFERALPPTLSAGEQQRACIARAVATRPRLIVADEPTGNLDPRMAEEVMNLFARFNEAGVSVLIASHALDLIAQYDCRTLHLRQGRLSEHTPGEASDGH